METYQFAPGQTELLTPMYEQLHAEINQRLEMRQGVLTFALLVAASLFGLGLQSWANAVTVLCYPILALFLALVWQQHDTKIGQIAAYLRQLEDDSLGSYPGWEKWRRAHFKAKKSAIEIPAKGVFLVSELLAMVIGVARFTPEPPMMLMLFIVLIIVDVVSVALTGMALQHWRER